MLLPCQVLWPPGETAAAFTAVGTTREGDVCLAAATAAVTVAELADLLQVASMRPLCPSLSESVFCRARKLGSSLSMGDLAWVSIASRVRALTAGGGDGGMSGLPAEHSGLPVAVHKDWCLSCFNCRRRRLRGRRQTCFRFRFLDKSEIQLPMGLRWRGRELTAATGCGAGSRWRG